MATSKEEERASSSDYGEEREWVVARLTLCLEPQRVKREAAAAASPVHNGFRSPVFVSAELRLYRPLVTQVLDGLIIMGRAGEDVGEAKLSGAVERTRGAHHERQPPQHQGQLEPSPIVDRISSRPRSESCVVRVDA